MPDAKALEAFGQELDKSTVRGSTVIPGVVAAAVDRNGQQPFFNPKIFLKYDQAS